MNRQQLTRRLALTLALIVPVSARAFGQVEFPPPPRAALLDLKITPDGSVDPPGDRLVGDVLLYPGTDRVDVVVEADAATVTLPPAAEVSPAPPPSRTAPPAGQPVPPRLQVRPLEARDPALRGSTGRLQVRTTVKRPEKGRIAQAVVVVPRVALALVPEDRMIRYTMRGEIGGTEVFFKAADPVLRPEQRDQDLDVPAGMPAVLPVPAGAPPVAPAPAPAPPAAARPAAPSPAPPRPLPAPQAPSKTLPSAMPFPQAPGKTMPVPQAAAPQAAAPQAPAPQAPPLVFEALQKRTVLFATNRTVRAVNGTPSERFGNEVDSTLHHGSCLVNIPVDLHVQGKLELPGFLSGRDPAKYFLIDATSVLEPPQFLAIAGGRDSRRDVLVYVHGFNTTFDFAVMRLAQVVHDVHFAGVPVVFSWPSHGSAFEYDRDQDNAERSVAALTATLRELIDAQAARPAAQRGKVHVLAHSLGNRVTLRALAALDGKLPAGATPFGQIVLAAPDVSRAEFEREVPVAGRRADRVSLYFCPEDVALMASEMHHPGEPRAGRGVVPVDGLDNIDAHKANTSFLGHGYWADVKQFLIDLQMLVNLGLSPAQRDYTLEPALRPPPPHWRFR